RVLARKLRPRLVPEEHLHPPGLTVGRRREVRVVDVPAVGQAGRGVRSVDVLAEDGIVALEVPGGTREADRRGREMVVEGVHEEEELRIALVTVRVPRERLLRAPRAREPLRARGALELAERVVEVPGRILRRLLRRVRRV